MTSEGTQRSVLLLGEGNFSFAQALYNVSMSLNMQSDLSTLYATSFDSLDDLQVKYPNISRELSVFAKRVASQQFTGLRLCHNVDATRLRLTLTQSLLGQETAEEALPQFDDIIFNFPHLGFEDLLAHRCLVAHSIHSALECLNIQGTISIALAESQGIAWGIEEIAEKLDMVCSNKLVLHTQQWPGYEMKRHHVGKSFQTRVQHCLHYVLRRKAEVESVSEGNSPPLSILELIAQRRIAQLTASLLQDEVSKTTVSEVLPNSPTPQEVSAEVPTAADENNRAKKKRKALQLVETMFQVIVNKDTAINSYECLQCQKLFPTEQGVKTHCYKIHILENSMAPSSSGKLQDVETNVKTEYKCEQCERIFPNEEAIQQHRIAKHEGNFTYIAAASAGYKSGVSTSEVDRNKTEEAFQCSICQWKFASEEALQNHLQQGVIPVSTVASHSTATTSATEDSNNVKFQCSFCSKVLRDERAWKQHTNFCQLRHQNKTTSSTNL